MKDDIQTILDVMDEVDDWVCDDHNLIHRPSGLTCWIANGFEFFHIKGIPSLGIINRWKLWRKAKKLMIKLSAQRLSRISKRLKPAPYQAGQYL